MLRATNRRAGASASIRFSVAQPDFSVYVQRAKDADPDGIYVWIPAGAQPAALGKAMASTASTLARQWC